MSSLGKYVGGVIKRQNAKILVTASKTDLKWTSDCCGDRQTAGELLLAED